MNQILAALAAAARSFFSGRMMGLVLWPLLGATAFWWVVAWLGWGHWQAMFQSFFTHLSTYGWIGTHTLSWLGGTLAAIMLTLGSAILILVTALLITSILAMPAMVNEIARRHYPALERKHGGTNRGSILNAAWAVLIYLPLLLLSLPLWFLIPFGGAVFPLLLNGWLNARLFRYDALAEHASREEYRQLIRHDGRGLLLMGIALAAIQLIPSVTVLLIPLVILFMPVYTGLAFVHYALARLQTLRATAPSALSVRS